MNENVLRLIADFHREERKRAKRSPIRSPAQIMRDRTRAYVPARGAVVSIAEVARLYPNDMFFPMPTTIALEKKAE